MTLDQQLDEILTMGTRRAKEELKRLIEREKTKARIDTATDILYGFSRTYEQKVTDSDGNVYVNDSHGYISKYEVQELVGKLKAERETL